MTKSELRYKLQNGLTLSDCFEFRSGQDCEIFKAKEFDDSEQIIYVPDIDLNELRMYVDNAVCTDGEKEMADVIDEIIGCCYTGTDFVELCEGNLEKAAYLFDYCDWQHPSSAYPEIDDEDDL